MNIKLIKNKKTSTISVFVDGTDFGVFDSISDGELAYFPKRNDLITGSHLILIGHKLNELNGVFND